MTNEEAIRYWENLRKTFSEHMEKETNSFGKMHYQTSIEAIDVAVAALKSNQVGSEPLKYEQLRKMDGQVVREVIEDNGNIYEYLVLVNARDKDCIWLFDSYFHSGPYHNDDEFKEEGFTIYPYNPAHIDREAWEPCEACKDNEITIHVPEFKAMAVCNQHMDHGAFDLTLHLKFCPWCGRPLTPEAWAELERRLRK